MVLTWKWFSSILQFLGCLGVLVPGVCACGLLSVVLYTRTSVVLLGLYMLCAWVHCISCGYSLEYVLCAVHCPLDFALCEFTNLTILVGSGGLADFLLECWI